MQDCMYLVLVLTDSAFTSTLGCASFRFSLILLHTFSNPRQPQWRLHSATCSLYKLTNLQTLQTYKLTNLQTYKLANLQTLHIHKFTNLLSLHAWAKFTDLRAHMDVLV